MSGVNTKAKTVSILRWWKQTYPYSDHSDLAGLLKRHEDSMVRSCSEGSQPHVDIVPSPVDTVDDVGDDTRVLVVVWKLVDVPRFGSDLTTEEGVTLEGACLQ